MTRVPVVTSPCPLRWSSAPQAGKDFCGHCQRRVHNLDGLNDAERVAFLRGCSGKVCVFYTVRRPKAVAATVGLGLAAAAAVVAGAAPAEEWRTENPIAGDYCDTLTEVVITGGTEAGMALEWVDEAEAQAPAAPDLPQISASDWLPTPPDAHE
jgi:hypothetical protein